MDKNLRNRAEELTPLILGDIDQRDREGVQIEF